MGASKKKKKQYFRSLDMKKKKYAYCTYASSRWRFCVYCAVKRRKKKKRKKDRKNHIRDATIK